MKLFILGFLTISLVNASSVFRGGKIVQGLPIDITEVPFQIALILVATDKVDCGGSIISANYVLTAAHCTDGKKAADFKVRAGSSKFASGGTIYKVQKIIQHAKYNDETVDYDIALLQLKTSVVFSAAVQAIALPDTNFIAEVGTMCRISGWGILKFKTKNLPALLRGAYVPIVNQEICMDDYWEKRGPKAITPRMICAGFEDATIDTCQGDSGGPLAAFDYLNRALLYGVVSWGEGCAAKGFPGVYVKVAFFRDWIRSKSGV